MRWAQRHDLAYFRDATGVMWRWNFSMEYEKTRQVRSFVLGDFLVPRRLFLVAMRIKNIGVVFDTVSICLSI